jgi:hypothetical protein
MRPGDCHEILLGRMLCFAASMGLLGDEKCKNAQNISHGHCARVG